MGAAPDIVKIEAEVPQRAKLRVQFNGKSIAEKSAVVVASRARGEALVEKQGLRTLVINSAHKQVQIVARPQRRISIKC